MDEFSQLTLELFMNKNAYNRYVEKTDPNKFQERQDYINKALKYKGRILDITRRYIDNPDLQITTEMNDMFSDYCKTCIKYFELKDLEEACTCKDEDETMFDPQQMDDCEDNASTKVNVPLFECRFRKLSKAKYTPNSFM